MHMHAHEKQKSVYEYQTPSCFVMRQKQEMNYIKFKHERRQNGAWRFKYK